MNQILVTQKLYITPELKRKKKIFKLEFFISVFLLCLLSSYIYAEYNRNESEQVSQQILSEMNADSTIKKSDKNDIMVIMVDGENDNIDSSIQETENEISNNYKSSDGKDYSIDAKIKIPSIGIEYPVLSETASITSAVILQIGFLSDSAIKACFI